MPDKYPRPKIDCPKCGKQMTAQNRLKVSYRSGQDNHTDWKILERRYLCPKCSHSLMHEVAAKEPEPDILFGSNVEWRPAPDGGAL
jgi:acetone carboxylase gamma subunit